jgi:hypothetical protein
MLPNKLRGVPRVDDQRVLDGIFWVLRSVRRGAICRRATDCLHAFIIRVLHRVLHRRDPSLETRFSVHALVCACSKLRQAEQV